MKSLETVQKAFNVFKQLTKTAEILCIVGASVSAVAALCTAVVQNGGQVFGIFGEPIEPFIQGDMKQAYVKLMSITLAAAAYAVVLGFAHNYLKHEQAEGTPFTEKGAGRLKMLGIRCIYIPLAALLISAVISFLLDVKNPDIAGNLPSTVIGIALILVSLVFRYGAELESKNQAEKG